MSLVSLLTLSTRNSHSVFFSFLLFSFFLFFLFEEIGSMAFWQDSFPHFTKEPTNVRTNERTNERMLERTNERTRFIFKNYFGEMYQLTSSFLSIYVPSNSTSYETVLCIEIRGFSWKSLYKQVAEKSLPFFSYSIICPLRKILRYLSFLLNYYDR
jgi:hypothetical protein